MTELLFLTAINKRCLEEITPLSVLDLKERNLELIEFLSWFKPETQRDASRVKAKIKEYRDIQDKLNDFGLKGVVPKVKSVPPTQIKNSKSRKSIRKSIVDRCHNMRTSELLEENLRLIEYLQTFQNSELNNALVEFTRFMNVQNTLRIRDVPCATLTRTPQNKSRIILLLGDQCSTCGSKTGITLHHVKQKKDGGNDKIQNLKVLCRICHDREHDMNPAVIAQFKEYKKFIQAGGGMG